MSADAPNSTLDIRFTIPDTKIVLHDGVEQVKSIAFVSVLRDCEDYLPYMFKLFDTIINTFACKFEFYFLENDSKDTTNVLLSDWIETRDGSVFVYRLKDDYPKTSHGIDHRRISTISMLRNKIIDAITPVSSKWTIMMDSHVYLDPIVIKELFDKQPALNRYGMICPFTGKLFPVNILNKEAKERLDATDKNKMVSINHYYDTYSLVDIGNKMHHPLCPFEKCQICTRERLGAGRYHVPAGLDIVEVNACFGGFAMIESSVLANPRVRWDSISYESKMDLATCEHMLFCDRLKAVTGKKIVIAQNVDKIFRTK